MEEFGNDVKWLIILEISSMSIGKESLNYLNFLINHQTYIYSMLRCDIFLFGGL